MRYLRNGSWHDAERDCRQRNSHLWSINTHEEWWNVYLSLGMPFYGMKSKALNVNTTEILLSTLFFIGGITNGKVTKTCEWDNWTLTLCMLCMQLRILMLGLKAIYQNLDNANCQTITSLCFNFAEWILD